MKIAVTGANGRVGRAVVDRAAAAGHTVVAIDRRHVDVDRDDADVIAIDADVTDYDALEQALAGCDALIHLAAFTGPGMQPDHVIHDQNVVGSYHALRAAAGLGIERMCQASSVNAIGGRFSRVPHYDYFPLDEAHPTYAEDPYSLSKWICEQQADAIARRFEGVSIASLRLHGVVPERETAVPWEDDVPDAVVRHLWGYVRFDATAQACLAAIDVDLGGHEVFYIVAPDTMSRFPTAELCARHYPDVRIDDELVGNVGLYDCRKAAELLGWTHDPGDRFTSDTIGDT
jgi:UDP-glucose 4-epimerase